MKKRVQKKKETTPSLLPSRVWRSRISWRITLTAFVTILLVQALILMVTAQNYKEEKLTELRTVGLAAMAPLIEKDKSDLNKSPITHEAAQKIIEATPIMGFSIFALDGTQILTFGEPRKLTFTGYIDHQATYLSPDMKRYEAVYGSSELRAPYSVVVRMDSSRVRDLVYGHIKQTIVVVLLVSAFVTNVLMIAMGHWLLEPIMVLRNNLLAAAKNPESPQIQHLDREARDEVHVAIRVANDLIQQNATNMLRLRVQAEDRIHKLAYYDSLTNLPNRVQFMQKLDEAIEHVGVEGDRAIAVIAVDLDHFKDINDTMGHEFGDQLLKAVGERLQSAAPDHSIVARASADEFMIMSLYNKSEANSGDIIDGFFRSLSKPIKIMQEDFQMRASIGVARFPEDGAEGAALIKHADIALNRAKEEGRDTVRYYSEDFDRAVQARFQLLRDLRAALDGDQLTLHYHPQFDLKDGRIIGAEALLRWWRPDNSKAGGSFVSPVEFIPVAEQSGLIVPIGEWVLRTACKQNKAWQEAGLPPFRVAVNISAAQFHRSDMVRIVQDALADTGLEPKWLEMEVTESVFMQDIDTTIAILNQLSALGVELAVDDFGTGYSSLSYLRQFPIDRLKIDQSFIRNALTNEDDMTITRTIINLGHSLGLKVIAEGVETQEHEDFLKEHGCDEVQGFKYSKPIAAGPFKEFVEKHALGKKSNIIHI